MKTKLCVSVSLFLLMACSVVSFKEKKKLLGII